MMRLAHGLDTHELTRAALAQGRLHTEQAEVILHALAELPDDLDPEFDPIRDAFTLLGNLHSRRNRRSVAETIQELLETTRAHAGFAFRKGGERVLANVYRLTDLARSFEAAGAATSFRSFVEYLESEYEGSDTSEAWMSNSGSFSPSATTLSI